MTTQSDPKVSLHPRTVIPIPLLHRGRPYVPSWKHNPVTTWTERLAGHYGTVATLDIKTPKVFA